MDEVLSAWQDKVAAHLIAWPLSRHVHVEYAETGAGVAQCRIRITLTDGSLLQCVERVRATSGSLVTEKYSFHWQDPAGALISRWDNAPHHRELSGFPHHVHEADENQVHPHAPVNVFIITDLIEAWTTKKA